MKNKYKIGIAFLLTMFMALIYSPKVFAAPGVVINEKSCTAANGTNVTFTITIENALNNVSSFALNVSYDPTILKYVRFVKSDLGLKDEYGDPLFTINANKDATKPIIKVGGYNTSTDPGSIGLPAGASGKIGDLIFEVLSCEPATVGMNSLADGIKNWPTQGGQLIAPVLHPPVLQAIDNQVKMFGNPIAFTAQATDEDNDAIIFSIAKAPTTAQFDPQTGKFSWTPTQVEAGVYPDITITAADSTGKSDSKTFQITVTEPHSPVFPAITKQTIMAGSTLSLNAQATDADRDTITYSVMNSPAGAIFNAENGNLSWTPSVAQIGSHLVTITATDSTLRSNSVDVTLEVILATMTVDNQSCRGDGEAVTFAISLNGAPAKVSSFGLEVTYDENILQFVPSDNPSGNKGDLTQGYDYVLVSKLVSKANTLKIAGVGTLHPIAAGSTGSIAKLAFKVKSCGPALINPVNLIDDVKGWSTKAGQLSVAPTIVCPGDTVVEADASGGASAGNTQIQAFLNGAIAHDAQNNPLLATTNAPSVFGFGDTKVTFTTVDGAGNSASCTATVSVLDRTAPVITCPDSIPVNAVDASGVSAMNPDIQAFLKAANTSDAVGVVSATTNAPAQFALGTTKVTFTVTDGARNKTSCESSVTVVDRTAPVVTCPESISVVAEGSNGISVNNAAIQAFLKKVAATDNVDSSVEVTNDAPATLAIGTTDIVFSAEDSVGNSSSCKATVTVTSNTVPVITCPSPGNITVEIGDLPSVPASSLAIQAFLNGATATDAEDGQLYPSHNAPAVFALGKTDVTFSATDKAGNLVTCTASVTVVDRTAPVITCPASITVNAESASGTSAANTAIKAFLNSAKGNDAVDGAVTVSHNAPAVFGIGRTEVTFSATDKAGNSSTCISKPSVTVVDNTPPVISNCPAGFTLEAEGLNGVPVSNDAIQKFLKAATAYDAVDGSVSVSNNAPKDFFSLCNTAVIFAATDKALNTSNCSGVIVSVIDTIGPVITCSDVTVDANVANGASKDIAAIQDFLKSAKAIDKVDGSVTVSNNAPDLFAIGVITEVTFTAKDSAGNSTVYKAKVTVVGDKVPPVITCPAEITIKIQSNGISAGNTQIQAFLTGVTANDAIDGKVLVSNNAPTIFKLGVTEVTFTAKDTHENSSTCKGKVTVVKQETATVSTATLTGGTSIFTGGLYGGTLYGGTYGGTLYGSGVYAATMYQPSSNLYSTFNQSLYNFQQSWNGTQSTSIWNPTQLWQPSPSWLTY